MTTCLICAIYRNKCLLYCHNLLHHIGSKKQEDFCCWAMLLLENTVHVRIVVTASAIRLGSLAGRWKGAIVAVKVIDHRIKGNGNSVDIQRETILSTSVVHPNVVRHLGIFSSGCAQSHPCQQKGAATSDGIALATVRNF